MSAAKDLASGWLRLSPSEIREFVSSFVDRVIVDQTTVEVRLDKAALSQHLLGIGAGKINMPNSDDNRAVIHLRADGKLQRCGGEVCLLIPAPGGESKIRPRPVPSLIKAIARAHTWYERLLKGDGVNCTSLATELGLGDRYVSRVLPFAFLARSHDSGHRFISERRLARVSSKMLSKPHSFTSMANIFSSTKLPRNLGWGSPWPVLSWESWRDCSGHTPGWPSCYAAVSPAVVATAAPACPRRQLAQARRAAWGEPDSRR